MLRQVAEGVLTHQSELLQNNAVVVQGRAGVLLVDPGLTGAEMGVCLGMQALVTSYGGTVDRVDPAHGEIALVNHDQDGLFRGVSDPFEAVRYHSLAAVALPAVLRQTAVDELSGVTMAVAHRDLPLTGVQFHPESILSHHGVELVRNFVS